MKKGVVACRVFYQELQSIIGDTRDIDVEYLPQGLHDLPASESMREQIQQKIDEMEGRKNYDYMMLSYGLCSRGVEGLKTKNAGLIVPLVHDCIPLLLGNHQLKENLDDGGTYYLSRGWIDCGGDTYKQHLQMIDKLDAWKERFESFQEREPDAVVDWFTKEKYRGEARKYPPEVAEYISFEFMKNYSFITLIDNENLDLIHDEYAAEMYRFLRDLLKRFNGKDMVFRKVKGNLMLLRNLIYFDRLTEEERNRQFLIVPPGKAVELEGRLRDQDPALPDASAPGKTL